MDLLAAIKYKLSNNQPQPQQLPEGDPTRGKKVFEQHCADCHYLHRGDDSDFQAPRLGGLIGRRTGSTGYKASAALKKANFKWDQMHLFKFLRNPQRYIPGNLMVWPGMKNVQQRADLIAFLKRH